MEITTKKFELTEIYVEDAEYALIHEKAKEYRAAGYAVTNAATHFGKNGHEEDKMYWFKATKKVGIGPDPGSLF